MSSWAMVGSHPLCFGRRKGTDVRVRHVEAGAATAAKLVRKALIAWHKIRHAWLKQTRACVVELLEDLSKADRRDRWHVDICQI